MMQSRLRKDPQQARSRRTVDSILEAADRVLRTDGYLAASTNRLARVAGFSVGSLYQYFDDKESVVGELIDRTLAEEARVLAEHMETRAGRPLAEQVAALVEWAVQGRWVQSHLFESLSHHASELAGGDALPFTMHALDAPAILHQHLAPGLARVRPAGPLDEMVYVIAAVVNAASFHFAVHRPPAVSSAALVDHLTAALMTYAGNGTGDVLARPGASLQPARPAGSPIGTISRSTGRGTRAASRRPARRCCGSRVRPSRSSRWCSSSPRSARSRTTRATIAAVSTARSSPTRSRG